MGRCEAWLNGEAVGTVHWDIVSGRAVITCTLPDGWIYRAVLLLDGKEIAHFGVLLPKEDRFSGALQLPVQIPIGASLHCEVLRSQPGEKIPEDDRPTMKQFSPWTESVF